VKSLAPVLPLSVKSLAPNSVVGFEVLQAVVTKRSLFRDVTEVSLLKVNSRFGSAILFTGSHYTFSDVLMGHLWFHVNIRYNVHLTPFLEVPPLRTVNVYV
jgi:hypothetical protein